LDEAASPREGIVYIGCAGLEGECLATFWHVISLDFRPLWLEFHCPHERVSRCQNSETA